MSDDNQENLRDLAAMFALTALINKHTWLELRASETKDALGIEAYELADALLGAKAGVSVGIASAKRKRSK
jgi:hypothetical protein